MVIDLINIWTTWFIKIRLLMDRVRLDIIGKSLYCYKLKWFIT